MLTIHGSIVLYHTKPSLVEKAIQSFLNTELPVKLSLIDNSSNDDLAKLSLMDNRIEYHHTGKNFGYGAAHNIAIRKTLEQNIPYHLVLNPDVHFEKGVLEGIIEFMQQNQQTGQLIPKVYYPDGTLQHTCRLLPTPVDMFVRRFVPFQGIKDKNNYKYELRFTGYNQIMNVPYLLGSFMFFRTAALRDVGIFDERFFMYPEDIDMTRRIHRKYQTIFFPKVQITHEHARSSYKSTKMMFIHMFNMVRYFNKWGWLFDSERRFFNKRVLSQFGE